MNQTYIVSLLSNAEQIANHFSKFFETEATTEFENVCQNFSISHLNLVYLISGDLLKQIKAYKKPGKIYSCLTFQVIVTPLSRD